MGLFKKKLKQEHKVMVQHDRAAGALLPEYHRATTECPHPEQWSMFDSMTAELEVLELLATLVTTVKPRLVVETGSFLGVSTEWIARGLARNAESGGNAGKVISCEFDPVVYARAKERLAGSPYSRFMDLRQASSLEMPVEGTIDMLFSDSDPDLREAEVHAPEDGARSREEDGARGPDLDFAAADAAWAGVGAAEDGAEVVPIAPRIFGTVRCSARADRSLCAAIARR
jgi:predicted O-methyltransferase YrrM